MVHEVLTVQPAEKVFQVKTVKPVEMVRKVLADKVQLVNQESQDRTAKMESDFPVNLVSQDETVSLV